MSILEAVLLGLIQGLTEFLPISSTAHLTLAARSLGLIETMGNQHWTAFQAVIQLGTLAAVLAYFRKDIVVISRAFIAENVRRIPFSQQSGESRNGWFIIAGTIPIVVIGLVLQKVIEGGITKDLMVIGGALVGLALLLEVAERVARFNRPLESVTMRDAIIIGLAQASALVPGASRSGTTITAGLFRGMTREGAARFSFLLSIPAVLSSGLLQFWKSIPDLDRSSAAALVVATVVSGLVGYWSIAFLLRYLRTRTTRLFVVYRIILGGGILLGIAMGWLSR